MNSLLAARIVGVFGVFFLAFSKNATWSIKTHIE